MDFSDIDSIKENGFKGFYTINSLWKDSSVIPSEPGVYMVLRISDGEPSFLHPGVGGFFKGKDPNLSEEQLQLNVVTGTPVVYIGKAGSLTGSATLRSRLRQYLKFGQGRNIGHYGGRLIWQLKDHADLVLCWKPVPDDDPRIVEKEMLGEFIRQYGKRPYANLTG